MLMLKAFALKVAIVLATVAKHIALVIVTAVLMLAAFVIGELIGRRILHID